MNHETAVSNAKEIADRILAPAARQNDKEARFSSEAVAALGPAGLLGIMLPTELGGSALGPRTLAAVIATLALLLLGGVNHPTGHGGGWVARLQHAARPLEHQLHHAFQKAPAP